METDAHQYNLHYVLIDDELLTRTYLERVVSQLRPGYVMEGESGSVSRINALLTKAKPDFIISGILLADGNSIEEYRRLQCTIPKVIYTAYPENLIDKDELNVVHLSLKPVPVQDVKIAIEKVEEAIKS